MKRKTLLITSIILFIIFGNLSATSQQSPYQKAWQEFFNNNRTEARTYFTQSLDNDNTKADSYLGLCLLDWCESKHESAFDNLKKFYNSSSQPDAYLYGLFTTPFTYNYGDVLEKEKLEFFEGIVAKPMNGTLKAMIHELLGKHYMACKDFTKAKELFSQTGTLMNWQILGGFNNISGSGFDKDWGAVKKSQLKDEFENKNGAKTNWHTPGLNKPEGWFDFTYYFPLNGIIAYAQTFVTSPQVQDVYLRTGTSGSLKIWVNDVLTGSVREERNCDMDLYGYKVKLNKGVNRILVQLGQSEIDRLNFMMRVTDVNGDPVSGISEEAKYAKYNKGNSQGISELLPFFPEEYLSDKVKTDSNNPIHSLVLAEVYMRNDKAEDAISLLKEVQKKAPKSSFVHHRLAEAYVRAKNTTYHTREIENLKLTDPDSFFALESKSNEAMASDKINEVKSICQKMKELYGDNITTNWLDIWLASKQGNQEELRSISRKNYEKYPHRHEYMSMVFGIEENMMKNSKAATVIIEDFCSKYFHLDALETLSGRYIKDGDTEKGLNVLKERIEIMPYAIGFQRGYARTLYQMQRYQEALEITDRMLKLSPTLGDIYVLRAEIYKEMKDKKQAIENYKKSVYYEPTLFDSRTQLRQLEGKKELYEILPKYNLDSLIAKAPNAQEYPDDGSIIFLYDTQLTFHPEGAKEYHTEMAVKIFNQSGIDAWSEYNIPYYGNQRLVVDKYEVIKANGQKVKAETDGGGHIVFTNLEIGDVLYMEYRIREYSTDILSKHFYDHHTFQYYVPTMVVSYSILAPKNKEFKHIISNGKVEYETGDIDNMKLYKWTLTNQPSIKPEPLMSNLIDVAPTLTFSSITDWKFVSNWYKDLTTNKFTDDYLLTETVNDILKGKENSSKLEKAKLFYNYILRNISYSNVPFMQNNFIPQKASRTLSTRLGDCKDVSTLFVAMCRKAGIDANMVLILTRENGRNSMPLPMIIFNHCIARLNVDNKIYYLELTDNYLGFNAVHEFDMYTHILPIPYGNENFGDKLLSLDVPHRVPNKIERISSVRLENNDMYAEVKNISYGSYASGIRHSYSDLGNDERLKRLTPVIAAVYNTPIKINNLVFEDLKNLADTAVYNYELEAKNIVQEIAGIKIFKLRWLDSFTSPEEFAQEERKTPFEFWAYMSEDQTRETLTLILPEGKKLLETPQDIHLECANAVYDLKYDLSTPGMVKIERLLKRKTEIVTPKEYEEFRKFMQLVIESDNKQYGIN